MHKLGGKCNIYKEISYPEVLEKVLSRLPIDELLTTLPVSEKSSLSVSSKSRNQMGSQLKQIINKKYVLVYLRYIKRSKSIKRKNCALSMILHGSKRDCQ